LTCPLEAEADIALCEWAFGAAQRAARHVVGWPHRLSVAPWGPRAGGRVLPEELNANVSRKGWIGGVALCAAGLAGCASLPAQRVLATVPPRAREVAQQIRLADVPGHLLAGAAKVDLDIPAGTPLAGYARRKGRPSVGLHDPLYARSVAFSDGEDLVFFVSADILLIPHGFSAEVARRLDAALPESIGPEDLMLCATHTHSGPGAYLAGPLGRLAAGEYQPAVYERLVAACVEAGGIDGLTRRREETVDGLPVEAHAAFVALLRTATERVEARGGKRS